MSPTDTDKRLAEIHARLQAAPTMTGPGGTLTDAHCAVLNNAHADLAWLLELVQRLTKPGERIDPLERFGLDEADLDFVVWFFGNADFGPAGSDVYAHMFDAYERETGVKLSARIDWRKEKP